MMYRSEEKILLSLGTSLMHLKLLEHRNYHNLHCKQTIVFFILFSEQS